MEIFNLALHFMAAAFSLSLLLMTKLFIQLKKLNQLILLKLLIDFLVKLINYFQLLLQPV